MNIKDLELSDADFKLLIDGLDALPHRGQAGEFAADLLVAILPPHIKNSPQMVADERKREQEMRQKEKQKEALIEDIKILQGKLLMLKRHFIEMDALKQTNDIINKK